MVRFPAVARFNFLDFPENFKKIVSVCTEKRRNPGCSLAVEYLYIQNIYIYIYIYIETQKKHIRLNVSAKAFFFYI